MRALLLYNVPDKVIGHQPEMHLKNTLVCLTQTGFPALVCDHERAIAAARTALNVKIPKQQSQRAPLWHTKPPLTPGVTGVGAWIVLRGQRARLWAQHRMSTAIT